MELPIHQDPAARRAFASHPRVWQHNRYVYPVVSRRSKGISIGINLNPDKVCNFDCIYCCVDRTVPPATRVVDLALLHTELEGLLEACRSGGIYDHPPFDAIPPALRRINDIAFSGDGEPTTFGQFGEACRMAAKLRDAAGLTGAKLVVITNATMFHRPHVREALAFLDAHNGEIWGKLDAGTAAYYDLVDRTSVPFQRVLDNLLWAARVRPIVIQSLFMRVHGAAPPVEEVAAFAGRLRHITEHGGKLKLVQIYTVARHTTEAYATALEEAELEAIAQRVRGEVPHLPVEVYP